MRTPAQRHLAAAAEATRLRDALVNLLEAMDAVDAEAARAETPGASAWSSVPVVRMLHAREAARKAVSTSA